MRVARRWFWFSTSLHAAFTCSSSVGILLTPQAERPNTTNANTARPVSGRRCLRNMKPLDVRARLDGQTSTLLLRDAYPTTDANLNSTLPSSPHPPLCARAASSNTPSPPASAPPKVVALCFLGNPSFYRSPATCFLKHPPIP